MKSTLPVNTQISVNQKGARYLLKDMSRCEFCFLFLNDICENVTFTIMIILLMFSKADLIYLCMVKTWHLVRHTRSCCHCLCHTYSYKWKVVSELCLSSFPVSPVCHNILTLISHGIACSCCQICTVPAKSTGKYGVWCRSFYRYKIHKVHPLCYNTSRPWVEKKK